MKSQSCLASPRLRHRVSALTFLVFFVASVASGATLYTAKTGADHPSCGAIYLPCLTIQYTIDNRAAAGDVISIGPGHYVELITVDKNLTLRGSIASRAAIEGGGQGPVVTVPAGVKATLEWLKIRNGSVAVAGPEPAVAAGGIDNAGTLTLSDSVVTGNQAQASFPSEAPLGGGIVNTGTLVVERTSIVANAGSGGCFAAGGLISVGGTLTVEDSLIANNTAASSSSSACGGPSSLPAADGLLNNLGTAVVDTTTLRRNGAVNDGTLTLSQSTISDASSGIVNAAQLIVVNSTIANNGSSVTNLQGEFGGKFNISNSTVIGNGSGLAVGIPLASIVRNSILAGNAGGDCTGDFTDGDYNIIEDRTGCTWVGGGHDLIGVPPLLGRLRDNGGPTKTRLPLAGSPAINGGNPAGCADSAGDPILVDQRGFPRPSPRGGRCDIGSVEVQQPGW